ncbi:MAG: type II CAAX prenyl endopeptidase Rce1 family protein [Chlorobium sp.]
MTNFSFPDHFAAKRPSFLANTLFLTGIMVLYPLAGAVLFSLVGGGHQAGSALLHPVRGMLPLLRMVQSVGQILVLALPVLLLAAWHTGKKNPFSPESLAFLGVRRSVDFGSVVFAVSGIFLLQPLLYTVTTLQDLYLWPSLGTAGGEVVRQRDVMDSFIKELALVRTVPEFLSVALVFAVTPAVCEELFFRGYIQQNYTRSMSAGGAVLLTGFVFAFFHLSAANLLPLALLGWYIGYIYSATGNIVVSFFVHLMNNLAALLLLLFAGDGDFGMTSRPESLVNTPLWWLVVAGSLFLFVMVVLRFSAVLSSRQESL